MGGYQSGRLSEGEGEKRRAWSAVVLRRGGKRRVRRASCKVAGRVRGGTGPFERESREQSAAAMWQGPLAAGEERGVLVAD